jgi:hypothetical protein
MVKPCDVKGSFAMTSGSPIPITARPPGRSTRASSAQATSSSRIEIHGVDGDERVDGTVVQRKFGERAGRKSQPARLDVAAESRPGAPQHFVGDFDAMHAAVVADAIQQELQSHTAAETDVRGDRAARNLRGLHCGGDRPFISPVECTRDEWTQDSVRAAELSGHCGQQPLAYEGHGSIMTITAPADARRWPPPS